MSTSTRIPKAVLTGIYGGPAVRLDLDGELDRVASLVIEDGRIARIYAIRNPHKLARLDEKVELCL
jgi:RNA polymerase sigma-70 factor (ECF subfamily)